MATTFTEVLPATKTAKCAIDWTPAASGAGLLTIHDARKSTDYAVQPLATTWGRGFSLAKLDGSERYSVLCGKAGESDRCDCAGFCYRPNQPCRHIAACKALIENEFLWTGAETPIAKPAPVASRLDTADQDFF